MLTAYNCSGVRVWQQWEIDFLQHLANQMAIAIEQSQLYRQLAIANQKLQQLATTDGLTGIANRRQFDRVFRLEWRRLARSAQESPDTLILRADSALYQAKTEGKNRICHASSN